MIAGYGWEVWVRDVLGGEGRWEPVAFFVPAANPQGIAILTLILEDGKFVPATGKLRREPEP